MQQQPPAYNPVNPGDPYGHPPLPHGHPPPPHGFPPPHPMGPQPVPMGAPMQNVNVTMAAPAHTIVMAPSRPNSYIILACFVIWCINPIFGLIAFALSLASSSAADGNDLAQARKMGRASMWVSVAGILVGVILIIVVIVVVVTAVNQVQDDVNDWSNNYLQNWDDQL